MLFLRTFGWSLTITALVLVAIGVFAQPPAVIAVTTLAILEVSLSFDNAVVNATVLRRMNRFWTNMFLTLGVLIAVFGMRLVFPFVVVTVTSGLEPLRVVDLALNDPTRYAAELHSAHPAIAAFGGVFLLMIFLEFFFDGDRPVAWLRWLEHIFARAGRVQSLANIVALLVILALSVSADEQRRAVLLTAGILGLTSFLAVRALGEFFENSADSAARGATVVAGRAAFALFLYLEVLDASFSFDGVIAAFAISSDIFVIAAGLGIGALYIRSLTVYLVRADTLTKYVYLEHGAHYAIGALAVLLMVSIDHEVPDAVTSLFGAGIIVAALVWSVLPRRRQERRAGSRAKPADTADDVA